MARRTRKDGTPARPNRWHVHLMDLYSTDAYVWWLEAERVTMLYATELAEHKLVKPHPQLKDYMIRLSREWRHISSGAA